MHNKQLHRCHGGMRVSGGVLLRNVNACQESPGIFHVSVSYQQGIEKNSCLTDLSKSGNTRVCVKSEATTRNKEARKRVKPRYNKSFVLCRVNNDGDNSIFAYAVKQKAETMATACKHQIHHMDQ